MAQRMRSEQMKGLWRKSLTKGSRNVTELSSASEHHDHVCFGRFTASSVLPNPSFLLTRG